MNIDTFKIKSNHWSELLRQMDAFNCCSYARSISYKEFWDNSPRGDWLLLFAANEGSTPYKLIVNAAYQCAKLSFSYVKPGDVRPLQAIETTERWLEGKATIEEVKLAAAAAAYYAANATHYTYYASASSYATHYAAYATHYAYDAAYYASAASNAFVVAAANSKKEMQQKTADIVRSIIPMPTQAVNEFERLVKMKAFW